MHVRLFLILFLAMLSTAIGLNVVVPLLPVYVETMGAGGIGLALIYAGFAFARAVFLPFVDTLSRRFNRRYILIFGLFCNALVAIFFIMSNKVYHLVASRMFHGFGQSLVMPPIRAYVGEMASPGEEGKAIGLIEMAFAGGLAIGPIIGGKIYETYGMAVAFTTMGAFSFIAMWVVIFGIRKVDSEIKENISTEVLTNDNKLKNLKVKTTASMFSLFKNFKMLSLFSIRALSFLPSSLLWTFQILYLSSFLNFSSSQTGLVITVNLVCQTLAQPFGGKLADTYDRMLVNVITGLLMVGMIFIVPSLSTVFWIVFLNGVIGFVTGLQQPAQLSIAVSYGNKHNCMSASMNFMDLAFSIGMVLGPLFNGLIWNLTMPSATYITFYVAAGVGVLAYLIYFIAMRKYIFKKR